MALSHLRSTAWLLGAGKAPYISFPTDRGRISQRLRSGWFDMAMLSASSRIALQLDIVHRHRFHVINAL
jgi:hypothetical protein